MQYAKPSESFVTAYTEAYKAAPGITADTAYDTLFVLKQEIEEVGNTDVSSIVSEMRALKTFSGVSGDMTFDGKGSVTKPPVLHQVQNGSLVEVK